MAFPPCNFPWLPVVSGLWLAMLSSTDICGSSLCCLRTVKFICRKHYASYCVLNEGIFKLCMIKTDKVEPLLCETFVT